MLPEGFLERTKGVRKVIGWESHAAALGHAAVGGFHFALWVDLDSGERVVWGSDRDFSSLHRAAAECVLFG